MRSASPDRTKLECRKIELLHAISLDKSFQSQVCDLEDRYESCSAAAKELEEIMASNNSSSPCGLVKERLGDVVSSLSSGVEQLRKKITALRAAADEKQRSLMSEAENRVSSLKNVEAVFAPSVGQLLSSLSSCECLDDEDITTLKSEIAAGEEKIKVLKACGDDLQQTDYSLGQQLSSQSDLLKADQDCTSALEAQIADLEQQCANEQSSLDQLDGELAEEDRLLAELDDVEKLGQEAARLEAEVEGEACHIAAINEEAEKNEALVADVSELGQRHLNVAAELSSVEEEIEALTREEAQVKEEVAALRGKLPADVVDFSEEEFTRRITDEGNSLDSMLEEKSRKISDLETFLANNDKEDAAYAEMTAVEKQMMNSFADISSARATLLQAKDKELTEVAKLREQKSKAEQLGRQLKKKLAKYEVEKSKIGCLIDPEAYSTPMKKVEQPNARQPQLVRRESSDDDEVSSNVPSYRGIDPFSPDSLRLKEQERMKSAQLISERTGYSSDNTLIMETDEGKVGDALDGLPAKPPSVVRMESRDVFEESTEESSGEFLSERNTCMPNGTESGQQVNDVATVNRFPGNMFLTQSPTTVGVSGRSSPSAVVSSMQDPLNRSMDTTVQSTWD